MTVWPYGKLEFKTDVAVAGTAVDPSEWPSPHAYVADGDTCRCGQGSGESDEELAAHAVDMTAVLTDDELTEMFGALAADHFEVADELLTKAEQRYTETKGAPNCAYCDEKATSKVLAAGSTVPVVACAAHLGMAKAAARKKADGKTPEVTMMGEVKAAGVDTKPVAAEHLREYWAHGPGAAKVKWGAKGDFDRCVKLVSKYMEPEKAKGYCNLRHNEAMGMWPAEHAAAVRKAEGKALSSPWELYAVKAQQKPPPPPPPPGQQPAAAGGDFNSKHPRNKGKFAPKGSSTVGAAPPGSGNIFDSTAAGILSSAHAATAAKAKKVADAAVAKAARTKNAADAKKARYLVGLAKAKAAAAKKATTARTAAAKQALALNSGQMTAVQKRLQGLFPSLKIPAEGVSNGATVHAVRLFQSQNGLPVTGTINKATYAALSNPKATAHDVGPTSKPKAGSGATRTAAGASGATGGAVNPVQPSAAFLANLTRIQTAANRARQGRIPSVKVFVPTLGLDDLLAIEGKAFDEKMHPRDKHGKFAHTGDIVSIGTAKGVIDKVEKNGDLHVQMGGIGQPGETVGMTVKSSTVEVQARPAGNPLNGHRDARGFGLSIGGKVDVLGDSVTSPTGATKGKYVIHSVPSAPGGSKIKVKLADGSGKPFSVEKSKVIAHAPHHESANGVRLKPGDVVTDKKGATRRVTGNLSTGEVQLDGKGRATSTTLTHVHSGENDSNAPPPAPAKLPVEPKASDKWDNRTAVEKDPGKTIAERDAATRDRLPIGSKVQVHTLTGKAWKTGTVKAYQSDSPRTGVNVLLDEDAAKGVTTLHTYHPAALSAAGAKPAPAKAEPETAKPQAESTAAVMAKTKATSDAAKTASVAAHDEWVNLLQQPPGKRTPADKAAIAKAEALWHAKQADDLAADQAHRKAVNAHYKFAPGTVVVDKDGEKWTAESANMLMDSEGERFNTSYVHDQFGPLAVGKADAPDSPAVLKAAHDSAKSDSDVAVVKKPGKKGLPMFVPQLALSGGSS